MAGPWLYLEKLQGREREGVKPLSHHRSFNNPSSIARWESCLILGVGLEVLPVCMMWRLRVLGWDTLCIVSGGVNGVENIYVMCITIFVMCLIMGLGNLWCFVFVLGFVCT